MTNLRLVRVVSFLFLIAAQALAQEETTSAIMGHVTDATNAAIPGATVTIRNPQTGLQRSAKTDEEGRFDFPQLGLHLSTTAVHVRSRIYACFFTERSELLQSGIYLVLKLV